MPIFALSILALPILALPILASRRSILVAMAVLPLPSAVFVALENAAGAAPAPVTVRIGYQKYGVLLVLKAKGELEKSLAPSNVKVEWAEFPGGIQLVEALGAGRLDLGVAGEAPPVFGQAAGAPLVYLAAEPSSPEAEALVVKKDSPIKTVADLKGKRLIVNKGANAHYLVVKALEEAGVKYTDVQVTFAPPADGRAAFEAGRVDAWAIWDPFLASAETAGSLRVLRDGKGLVKNPGYYVGARPFATAHPEIVAAFLEAVKKTDQEVTDKPQEVAALLAPQLGLPPAVLTQALTRSHWGVAPLGSDLIQGQQKIADTFLALQLITHPIKVADAVLTLPAAASSPAAATASAASTARATAKK